MESSRATPRDPGNLLSGFLHMAGGQELPPRPARVSTSVPSGETRVRPGHPAAGNCPARRDGPPGCGQVACSPHSSLPLVPPKAPLVPKPQWFHAVSLLTVRPSIHPSVRRQGCCCPRAGGGGGGAVPFGPRGPSPTAPVFLQVNNENVVKVGHRQVVNMIRQGGNHLVLKVVTVTRNLDPDDTARKKGARPAPALQPPVLGHTQVSPHLLPLGAGPPRGGKEATREAERGLWACPLDRGGSRQGCAQQPGVWGATGHVRGPCPCCDGGAAREGLQGCGDCESH